MAIAVADHMSKKTEPRDDVSVKMDREVVQLAKAAAALDNQTLAEWLSETIRPIACKRLGRPVVRKPKDDDE